MDEIEVQEILENGKLPITILDKFSLIYYVLISLFMLCLIVLTFIRAGFLAAFFEICLLCFFVIFIAWRQLWSTKQLTPYRSAISVDKKVKILEALGNTSLMTISDRYTRDSDGTPMYYVYGYKEDWTYNYRVTVFFDESIYYVSSIIQYGRSSAFSNRTADIIINKIKRIEHKQANHSAKSDHNSLSEIEDD